MCAIWNLVKVNTLLEVQKLMEIVLIIPVSTMESEHCFSTLERVTTYCRNSMRQENINALAVLIIHKDTLRFIQKGTELLASQKNQRGQFINK
jgi:hypothetical protein